MGNVQISYTKKIVIRSIVCGADANTRKLNKDLKVMNLYVVRHGETDMGKNHIIANETEPLNANGIRQAQNLHFHHQQKGMRGKKRWQY